MTLPVGGGDTTIIYGDLFMIISSSQVCCVLFIYELLIARYVNKQYIHRPGIVINIHI